jgi:AcrR family transcriptional regulator
MTTTASRSPSQDSSTHHLETAILEAARDLIADGGVAGLSMRQIADRVGVTATAIYHYFDGKQDIVNRVVLSAFERFGAYLKEAMESQPRGSVERLHALGEAYIRFAFENDAYFRVIFSIQPQSPSGPMDIPEGGGYQLLREAVLQGIDAGTIKDSREVGSAFDDTGSLSGDYADTVSMYLWSLAHGVVTLTMCGAGDQCDCRDKPDAVQLLRAFAPFINHGIRHQEKYDGGNEHDEEQIEIK